MQVHVLLFAAFREAVGAPRLDLEVPSGTTLRQVFALLERRYPRLAPLLPYTTYARNREVVDGDTVVGAGDEIVFLQPASGGSHD
jgi:molybdopterin converting factor small subunit